MGAIYTRQSTYADGDTITADHTNDEFDQLLAAFAASTGHTHDGTTAEGGPITKLLGTSITIGNATSGTDITVTFDGESNDGVLKWMEDEDYFEFSDDLLIASTEKIQFRDTGLYINSSADGQLDIVADTEIQIAATTIDINGLVDISGNLSVGGNLDVTGTFDLSDANFTNAGDIQLDSISGDSDTNTSITFSGSDVITVTTGGETQITFNNGSILPTTDNDVDLGSSSLEFKDIYIDGTAYLDAINFNGTAISATAAELNIMDGVTSTAAELNALDGITSTAAELNILDVSNSTLGDLSEISTVANDDVFLAVDTSGGGLKRIARSTVVAGLATSGAIANIVEDTSPQLGGNLDMNGADIVTTSNATLDLAPNGTGTVVVRGNTNSGAIVFNCESNSHGQKVFGQPHSASVTNTLMLPAGANSTLVSLVSTDTLTNKTLTSPKINEDVAVTSTATELNLLDGVTSTTAELNALDGITAVVGELNALDLGSTAVGTAIASKAVILDSNKDYTGVRNLTISGEIDAATGDFSGVVDVAGALTTAAITASGIIKTDDSTAATSTTDGSLQTDGGLSVVLDAVIGDDLLMLSDASVIHFGADSDVTLTHVADVGLALKHTATADDKPIVLTLQTGETDMAANDVIGKLAFQAPDEGTGTDAILVAAAVQAVAEGNFSSSNNATRLEFHTGASELAAVKMTLNSTGAVKPVTYQETYVSLSAAATINCPLLTANHFAVTIDENTTFTFGDPPASGTSFAFTLIITQHSTAVTITWPNTVDWAGGSAPDVAGNNEVQAYGFITRDGGTTYYGFLGGTAIG